MNLDLLRTFLELDRTRHFGRAAESLNLTQAAVSARIAQLEKRLGVRLFDRSHREIRPTPAGYRLRAHADAVLQLWRKARREVMVAQAAEQLAFGASLRLWDVLLGRWLQKLRQARPDLAIVAESQTAEMLTTRLLDGALDFALMLEPTPLGILRIEELAKIELVLVSTQAQQTSSDALGSGFVRIDWGLTHETEFLSLFPDAPEALTLVSRPRLALDHILALGGAAYLPASMVAPELPKGRITAIADAPSMWLTAYAVYPVRSGRLELIRECLRLLRDEAGGWRAGGQRRKKTGKPSGLAS